MSRRRHAWLLPIALLFVVASSCQRTAHAATDERNERTNATNAERAAASARYRASGLSAYRNAAAARRAARDANRKTRIGEALTKGDSGAAYKREFP